MKKQREANLELLRILAMFMVIVLHYLGKGQTLVPFGPEFGANSYIAWLLEALAMVAVNVYVFLSGYFLLSSPFRFEKCAKLWFQIFFYSAGIWVVMLLLGQIPQEMNNSYYVSMVCMPVASQHYWFATIYFAMYFLSPFLAIAANRMSKKQLMSCIIILLALFSRVWKLVLPMSTPLDDRGYGILWFLCLFFIAAYIRRFVPKNQKKWKHALIYVGASLLTFASFLTISVFAEKTGHLDNYKTAFYEYNAPFVIIASIALFLLFRNITIKEGRIARLFVSIGGLTFGVYLLHEHVLLRSLWTTLWKVGEYYQTPWFILHCFLTVLLVFIIGCIVEAIRSFLFGLLYRSKLWKFIFEKTRKLDDIINNVSGDKQKE